MDSKLILAIDGDTATLDFLTDLLSLEGYGVLCFQASQASANAVQQAQPDLIILDLAPQTSDNTVLLLDELREHPATKTIPIIVTSTSVKLLQTLSDPLHYWRCIAIEKPFNLDDLLTCVATALRYGPHRRDAQCTNSAAQIGM